MNNLIGLAGASSLLAGNAYGGGNTAAELLHRIERLIPGFSTLARFFKKWLKVDLTVLVTIAAIWGAVGTGFTGLQRATGKLYWWILRFLTASVSVPATDRLNVEVINWLTVHVLAPRNPRILTVVPGGANGIGPENMPVHPGSARSRRNAMAWTHWLRRGQTANTDGTPAVAPVLLRPVFGTTFFWFERHLFMVRKVRQGGFSHMDERALGSQALAGLLGGATTMPDEYQGSESRGPEPLVIMCLGRSTDPLKRLLGACRRFSEGQRERFVTVRATKGSYHSNPYDPWDNTVLRPLRPLSTVHLNEDTKSDLVKDVGTYLNPATHRFYHARGVPYRRGYLLYGPPGTGKTSLSIALAGHFGLELYLLHIPSVEGDRALEALFASLPPKCIVLLEDIDAVGIKERDKDPKDPDESESSEDSNDDDDLRPNKQAQGAQDASYGMPRKARRRDGQIVHLPPRRSHCTLAGLLNVLDGVASQEGRIVLMTSNYADKLDKALVRPGRIDKKIYLGHIDHRSAELMFLRMYAPMPEDDSDGPQPDRKDSAAGASSSVSEPVAPTEPTPELIAIANQFADALPPDTFTPAQIQGFLLDHPHAPATALAEIPGWVTTEKRRIEKAAAKAARQAQRARRKAERRKAAMERAEQAVYEKAVEKSVEKRLSLAGADVGNGGLGPVNYDMGGLGGMEGLMGRLGFDEGIPAMEQESLMRDMMREKEGLLRELQRTGAPYGPAAMSQQGYPRPAESASSSTRRLAPQDQLPRAVNDGGLDSGMGVVNGNGNTANGNSHPVNGNGDKVTQASYSSPTVENDDSTAMDDTDNEEEA